MHEGLSSHLGSASVRVPGFSVLRDVCLALAEQSHKTVCEFDWFQSHRLDTEPKQYLCRADLPVCAVSPGSGLRSKQVTRRVFSARFLSQSPCWINGIVYGTTAYKTGHSRGGQLKPHPWASPSPSSSGPAGPLGT